GDRLAIDATAAPQGAAFFASSVLSLFLTMREQRANNEALPVRGCGPHCGCQRGSFFRAGAAAARPRSWAAFAGDRCDETDLRCVCGSGGTAGFISIRRDRGAEDSQAMQ